MALQLRGNCGCRREQPGGALMASPIMLRGIVPGSCSVVIAVAWACAPTDTRPVNSTVVPGNVVQPERALTRWEYSDGHADCTPYVRQVAAVDDLDRDGVCDAMVVIEANCGHYECRSLCIAVSVRDCSIIWTVRDKVYDAHLGYSISRIGDQDSDGTPDVLLGRYGGRTDPKRRSNMRDGYSVTGAGPSVWHRGGVVAVSGAAGVTLSIIESTAPGDCFAHSIAAISDIDSDGVEDFAVAIPMAAGLASASATASVQAVSGKTHSILWTLKGQDLKHEGGGQWSDLTGDRLVQVRDIDGDGIGELAVAVPASYSAGKILGRVSIVSGRDGAMLHTIDCGESDNLFGLSLSGGLDMNSDGATDLAIGVSERSAIVYSLTDYVKIAELESQEAPVNSLGFGETLAMIPFGTGADEPVIAVGYGNMQDSGVPGRLVVYPIQRGLPVQRLTRDGDRERVFRNDRTVVCAVRDNRAPNSAQLAVAWCQELVLDTYAGDGSKKSMDLAPVWQGR